MNNKEKLFTFKYKATGIGSVPHTDIDFISDLIIEKCHDLPYWPQCANVDAREGMLQQFTENLPCLKLNANNDIVYEGSARPENLLEFYENLTSSNFEYFRISENYARGFYILLEKLKNSDVEFIKGQVVGPVTLLYSIIGENGKPVLFDDELCDAITRGLAMKAVWQAKEIKKAGKIPIIFFDEPSMSGFGSAFMSIDREQVTNIFDKLFDTVREHEDVITGMHCCGNSDWELLLRTRIDIINFDSFSFSKNFVIYTDPIKKFLNRDGIIAWGAVPTLDYNKNINIEIVEKKLNESIEKLVSAGIGRQFLLERSILTPACGLGPLNKEVAETVLDLTHQLDLRINSI